MASLNTLRTKYGIILSVIIGLGLFFFIVDTGRSMGTGEDPVVGEIAGEEVTYTEFQRFYENFRQQMAGQGDNDQITNQVLAATWQTLLKDRVVTPGLADLGLMVSENEYLDVISGKIYSQQLAQFYDPQTKQLNLEFMQQILAEAERNPQMRQQWEMLKRAILDERLMNKYVGLLGAGTFVNKLEVAQDLEQQNNTYAGQYISKSYLSVADSMVSVSDQEAKNYYESHKKMFKQPSSRSVSYVLFDVIPTDEDREALEQDVRHVADEFAATEDVRAFTRANHNGSISDTFLNENQLSEEEAAALKNGKMYGPVLKNNEWTLKRVNATMMAPDSIGLQSVGFAYSEENLKLVDSLMTAIKKGADIAKIAEQYEQGNGDLGVVAFSSLGEEVAAKMAQVKKGDVLKLEMGGGIQIFKVTRADRQSKHYQVASLVYPVEASDATRSAILNEAGDFAQKAQGSVAAFNNAAAEASLLPRTTKLFEGARMIQGLEDSRNLTSWAWGAEPEVVSEVKDVNKNYAVAIVTAIDNNDYVAFEEVKEQIKNILMVDKKYDYIVKNLQGATLEEQAASLQVEVSDFKDVKGSMFAAPAISNDPRVVGALTSLQKDQLSAPIKTMSGVVILRVDDVQKSEAQSVEGARVRREAYLEMMAQRASMAAISEMAEVHDHSARYF